MLNKLQEIFIAIVLIILLLLLWNPFGMGMGSSVQMIIVIAIILAFAIFAIFIWREKARDEREELHFSFAGKLGFLTGSTLLAVGILVQTFRHSLDMWLVLTLAAMILAKIAGLLYSSRNN